MDTIRLMNMSFYGFHGVTAAEKETGRRFEVDCELKIDVAEPGQTDMLSDTVVVKQRHTQPVRNMMEEPDRPTACPLCGRQTVGDSNYCSQCGTELVR